MPFPSTLHLTNFYHSSSGGVSAFYRALFRHADRHNRRMRLVVPGEANTCDRVGEAGRIYTVGAPVSPFVDKRYRLLMPFGKSGSEVRRIIRAEQPDILEISDKYSMLYVSGMLRKRWIPGACRPTEIATTHERLDDNVQAHLWQGGAGKRFADWYMRHIYFPMFDHHVANSTYTADELVPASAGHTTRRGIWVCPMGLNISEFPFAVRRPEGEGKRLLFAGRLAVEKNVDLLPEIVERLPREYTLAVAGDGPRREWLEQQAARRLPGRMTMLGHVGRRAELSELMARTDAFLHPNPREPFGITPLEAMATGLPVVAPRSGGILTYASDENAWLCDAEAASFADAVQSVFSNEAVRMARIVRARETAEDYDWSLIAARYFQLLDRLHRQGFRIAEPPLGAAFDAWRAIHAPSAVSPPPTAGNASPAWQKSTL